MKMKNAVVGTRVICKALPNTVLGYALEGSEGETGTIVGMGVDTVGTAFNGDDVVVRFDRCFNDDLWESEEMNGLVGEFHWGVPIKYLKLEEKSK
jgi:hypothetical protein